MARSKDSKSSVISGAGFLASVWLEIEAGAKAQGLEGEALHFLSTEEARPLAKPIGQAVAKIVTDALNAIKNMFMVVVDYGMSLEQMIAAGQYDWKNDDINPKNFPITGTGIHDVELELVHYGRDMGTDAVLADLSSRGLEPAKIEHLLAFGAKFPDKQREFPIVALGSVWQDSDGDRFVAYLDRSDAKRGLNLLWISDDWNDHCRFLAVRKSSSR